MESSLTQGQAFRSPLPGWRRPPDPAQRNDGRGSPVSERTAALRLPGDWRSVFSSQGRISRLEERSAISAREDRNAMNLIDRKILDLLQRDATLSIAEIGAQVGLSQTPCWKRIQRLEAQGVIERRVA